MTAAPGRKGAQVRVVEVSHRFDPGVPLLDRVSMTLRPGELVALSGPSGSGKSTLLQLIGGLDRPQSGEIWIDDVCVSATRHPVSLRRHDVGFVFQLHHLLPALTARANVELPLVAQRVPRAERRRRALEALGAVGLAGRAGDPPSALSGGERQRVAIARAIVHRPRLLLADEPTGALDARSAAQALALLDELRSREGMTILVVSHDPSLGGHVDRRLVLADGTISEVALAEPVPA